MDVDAQQVLVGGFFEDEDDWVEFQEWIWRMPVGRLGGIYACPAYTWPTSRPPYTPDVDTRHGQVTLRLMRRQWGPDVFDLIGNFVNFDDWWLESLIE